MWWFKDWKHWSVVYQVHLRDLPRLLACAIKWARAWDVRTDSCDGLAASLYRSILNSLRMLHRYRFHHSVGVECVRARIVASNVAQWLGHEDM
jgi:hypothetical protein